MSDRDGTIEEQGAVVARAERSLRRGVSWTTSFRAITAVSTMVLASLVSRYGGPETLGEYFVMLSIVGILSTTFLCGLPTTLVRHVAKANSESESASALLSAATVVCAAGVIGTIIFAPVHTAVGDVLGFREWSAWYGLILGAWALGLATNALLSSFYQGARRFGVSSFLGGASTFLTAILMLAVLGALGRAVTPLTVAISFVLGSWTSTVIAASSVGWRHLRASIADRRSSVAMLRESFGLYGMSLTLLVSTQADLWFVSSLMGPADAGRYALAAKLALFVSLPLTILSGVLMPVIARELADQNRAAMQRWSRSVATRATAVSVGIAMIGLASAPFVLPAAFRVDVSPELLVLLGILAGSQVGSVAVGPCAEVLLMSGHAGIVFKVTLASGLFAAIVTYVGAAWGSLVVVGLGAGLALLLQRVALLVACRRLEGIVTSANLLTVLAVRERGRAC